MLEIYQRFIDNKNEPEKNSDEEKIGNIKSRMASSPLRMKKECVKSMTSLSQNTEEMLTEENDSIVTPPPKSFPHLAQDMMPRKESPTLRNRFGSQGVLAIPLKVHKKAAYELMEDLYQLHERKQNKKQMIKRNTEKKIVDQVILAVELCVDKKNSRNKNSE